MGARKLPPRDFLAECFAYNPETGEMTWRKRPERHFASPRAAVAWNAKMAGRPAGRLSKFGYLQAQVTGPEGAQTMYLHRVAFVLMGADEPECVDHVNMDKADNRWANLRAATHQQNKRNVGPKTNRLKGTYYDKARGKFVAVATVSGKTKNLGRYDTEVEAHEAYCAYVKPIYGEFFRAEA